MRVEIRNSAKTSGLVQATHRIVIDRFNGSKVLTVDLRFDVPTLLLRSRSWVTVPDPVWSISALALQGKPLPRRRCRRAGQGEIRVEPKLPALGQLAVGRRVIAPDLMTTAEVINKRSQNFFAESLLKALGARLCGSGSWQAGLQVVEEFLERVGIHPGEYRLADGSGMSRDNQFSARQLTTVLQYMFEHEKGKEFLLTLPYSGEEGLRWEDRLADEPYRGNIFAKTGSLLGVSTLSGYAKGTLGKDLCLLHTLQPDHRQLGGEEGARPRSCECWWMKVESQGARGETSSDSE